MRNALAIKMISIQARVGENFNKSAGTKMSNALLGQLLYICAKRTRRAKTRFGFIEYTIKMFVVWTIAATARTVALTI